MAAIAYPRSIGAAHRRPSLRLVPPPTPSPAVFRRRRLAVLLVVALALVALMAVSSGWRGAPVPATNVSTGAAPGAVVNELAGSGVPASVPAGAVYVVQPGDTLWSIAARVAPGRDVRAEVDRLAALNGSSSVQAGQRLRFDGP